MTTASCNAQLPYDGDTHNIQRDVVWRSSQSRDPRSKSRDLWPRSRSPEKSDQRCADRQNFSSTVVRNFVNYCAL